MNLNLDTRLFGLYKSSSQKIRVISESWVKEQIYCPGCGDWQLQQYLNNRPVADFFCENCKEDFELKSKKDVIGSKVVDGAYQTMIERLKSVNNPNLFLLNYDLRTYRVLNFLIVPKHFFVPSVIERRNALAVSARRAGWVGCNILLQRIPEAGKIYLVRNASIESKEKVLANWRKTLFLREEKKIESKGWLLDVMRCIEQIHKKEFSLTDVYMFEGFLGKQHPNNRHIKDKIRQQLQILRDRGYIQFVGRGEYRFDTVPDEPLGIKEKGPGHFQGK
ncbi:MAG: restriction endonuclease [Candidatus Omnitrophica bacterium]|nr:restriction endonuclease [Candidatus Omnitrophota bacterium]